MAQSKYASVHIVSRLLYCCAYLVGCVSVLGYLFSIAKLVANEQWLVLAGTTCAMVVFVVLALVLSALGNILEMLREIALNTRAMR